MMGPMIGLIYAGFCYFFFVGVFVWNACFVDDLFVAHTVDAGCTSDLPEALAFDVGWFFLFGLQHSGMARTSFKRRFPLPRSIERATYVLTSSLLLALLVWQWRPIPHVLWRTTGAAHAALLGGSLVGWAIVFASSCMIDHAELFGLRQALDAWRKKPPREIQFRTPGLYRFVRHPLYVGLLVGFWSAPIMTVGHLVLATGMTAYIAVGVIFEERDLVKTFGNEYRAYQKRVRALVPFF